jgi:phosphate transport system substrate-binding protein
MNRKLLVSLSLAASTAMLLGACGAPAAAPTAEVIVQTQIVAGTPVEVVITATPGPTAEMAATSLPAGSVQLAGAGASFPDPIYQSWTFAYQYVDPSVVINYQPVGSGAGKKAIIDGTVDFAGSDSLVSDDEYAKGEDLQMLPMVAGAVVPVYNIDFQNAKDAAGTPVKLDALILDRATLADIYLGKITKWNDPAIVALNPTLATYLPDADIFTAHRSDGSGTTEVFTRALSAFSDDWKNGPAFGTAIEWPAEKAGHPGGGGKGNAGVAALVGLTKNSIGYVELAFALSNNMSQVQMVNKAGKTVKANSASVESAINDFSTTFTDKLTNVIVDGAGDGTWPISGYTYLVIHMTKMQDPVKAQKLLEYITWTQTDASAAQKAGALGYSVLPQAVRDQVLAKLKEVTVAGQPVLK